MGTNRIWRGLSLAAAGIIAAPALQGCGGPAGGGDAHVVTLDVTDVGAMRIPYEVIVRGNLIDEGLTT